MSWAGQPKVRRTAVLAALEAAKGSVPVEAVTAYGEAIKLLTTAAEPRKGYRKEYAEQIVIVEQQASSRTAITTPLPAPQPGRLASSSAPLDLCAPRSCAPPP